MNKILTFVGILLISCTSDKSNDCNYITDYYPLMYKADIAFEMEDYEEAFRWYSHAFKKCKAKNTSTFNEMRNYTESAALLGKFDVAYDFAKKQILQGIEFSRFENNPNFEEFLNSDYGIKFKNEYGELRQNFVNQANFELRDELIAMLDADQKYRGANYTSNHTRVDSIDKVHEKRLIELFETIGYPTDEMVGSNSRDYQVDVGVLLLHTEDSIRMNYFVPKVFEFVKNGQASPKVLGSMVDQYYLYNREQQIYGTYKAQGGGFANIIDDLSEVNRNRISIGLPSLELKEQRDSINRFKYGF
ncbi:MAG: hypothetical protein P1U56_21020 [Saprospiraceae bacterium]|nr:hypothetical protein [Saprospiraceae bacterium]